MKGLVDTKFTDRRGALFPIRRLEKEAVNTSSQKASQDGSNDVYGQPAQAIDLEGH